MSGERSTVMLVGDPVAHSVSPPMQQAAFDALGLPLVYTTLRVGRADLLDTFSRLSRTTLGLNVTAPLKEAVIPLLDGVDPSAAAARSVNTVLFGNEGSWGASTDGDGFLDALAVAGVQSNAEAVVLGSGGAARAVAAALALRGTAVSIVGRTLESVNRLVEDLSTLSEDGAPPLRLRPLTLEPSSLPDALSRADLLVNATPVGGWTDPGRSPIPNADLLHPRLTVFDLVYRPRRTRLLSDAVERGCRVVEGVEMLVRQGARSLEMWTGRPAPVEAMRAAAFKALEDEPRPAMSSEGGSAP